MKSLRLFIALKFHSDGFVPKEEAFEIAKQQSGFKDNRTINSHLLILQRLNWLGYDKARGNYLPRSFDKLQFEGDWKGKQAAVCEAVAISQLGGFLVAAVLSKYVNTQKYIRVMRARKYKLASNNEDDAHQACNPLAQHYGICNSIIGNILNCGQTRACQYKKMASQAGFIETCHHYKVFQSFAQADFNIIMLQDTHPNLAGRLKMFRQKDGSINLMEQLYDEIVPKVTIKTRRSFHSRAFERRIDIPKEGAGMAQ